MDETWDVRARGTKEDPKAWVLSAWKVAKLPQ